MFVCLGPMFALVFYEQVYLCYRVVRLC